MDLPAEIRNQIYSHLFPPQRVEILRLKQNNHYRLYHTQLPPRHPDTQNLTSVFRTQHTNLTNTIPTPQRKSISQSKGVYRGSKTQLSLPFTTRQSYNDTLCMLYASTQFVFTSTKSITRFLNTVPKQAQAAITHIELRHVMYNEPRLNKFRPFKLRADSAFYSVCESMVNAFESLRVVHFEMAVHGAPLTLEVGEDWTLPVLVFGGALGAKKREHGGRGLQFARVTLKCNKRFSLAEVTEVERELEMAITDPVAVQIRQDERLARESSGMVKAMRVLRVVFD